MLPEIRFSAGELETCEPGRATVEAASQQFRTSGALLLRDIFSKPLLRNLHGELLTTCSGYLEDKDYPDALSVGPGRIMITVALAGSFGSVSVYANPLVSPIVEAILGADYILNSFGVVLSVAGAAQQRTHRDHPGLFRNPGLDAIVPCYALSLIVPLVEITAKNGPTAVWLGSHRSFNSNVHEEDPDQPNMDLGSALLFDYRLLHRGGPNQSSAARPILYCSYSRPWFRDEANFKKQPPLLVDRETYASATEHDRRLLTAGQIIDFNEPQNSLQGFGRRASPSVEGGPSKG